MIVVEVTTVVTFATKTFVRQQLLQVLQLNCSLNHRHPLLFLGTGAQFVWLKTETETTGAFASE